MIEASELALIARSKGRPLLLLLLLLPLLLKPRQSNLTAASTTKGCTRGRAREGVEGLSLPCVFYPDVNRSPPPPGHKISRAKHADGGGRGFRGRNTIEECVGVLSRFYTNRCDGNGGGVALRCSWACERTATLSDFYETGL